MPVLVMCNRTNPNLLGHNPMSEQEFSLLFDDFLRLHPLPADLAARLTQRVMAEVAQTLQARSVYFQLPVLGLLQKLPTRWRSRRP